MATTTQPAHAEAPQQGGLLRAALVIFVGLSLVTGVLYPVVVTASARRPFPPRPAAPSSSAAASRSARR